MSSTASWFCLPFLMHMTGVFPWQVDGLIPWKVKSIILIVLLEKKIQNNQNRLNFNLILVPCLLAAVGSTGTTLGVLWT